MEELKNQNAPEQKEATPLTVPNTALEGVGLPPEALAEPEISEEMREVLVPEPEAKPTEEKAGGNSLVILLVVLVVVAVLAVLYFVGTRFVSAPTEAPQGEARLNVEVPAPAPQTPAYANPQTPTPQALDAIDEEAKKADLSDVDTEIGRAEGQMQ